MPLRSKLRGKTLHSQAREIVSNVYAYFQHQCQIRDEIATPSYKKELTKVQSRVAEATGVPERTVRRIISEWKKHDAEGTSFDTPGKKRNVSKRVTDLDDFDKAAIRRTVHNFYIQEGTVPTIPKLLIYLKKNIGYKGGSTSLRTIIKDIGFKWKKTKTNRRVLIEKHDIRKLRTHYLRRLKQYTNEGRPIVYEDETYIHSSHSTPKSWSDDSSKGLLTPVSRGSRLIIIHAGSCSGFVPNALAIFKSNQKTGDYHVAMNNENYVLWLKKQLIPNLPPNSVLVIDNASYHNAQLNKPPTSTSTNKMMIQWLTANGVPEDSLRSLRKFQLYDKIKEIMPKEKTYIIDQILRKHGHEVLRLPPYHPDLNPIELIWSEMKQWVGRNNTTFKMKDVENLCHQAFNEIGPDKWKKACDHVKKTEMIYYEQERILEDTIQDGGEGDDEEEEEEDDDGGNINDDCANRGENHSSDIESDSDGDLSGVEELM